MKAQWVQILLSLAEGTKHGAAIVDEVLDRTDGHIRLWPATLYGSLSALEDQGWIEEHHPDVLPAEGGRRRFYRLTPNGRAILVEEVRRLQKTLDAAHSFGLKPGPEPSA